MRRRRAAETPVPPAVVPAEGRPLVARSEIPLLLGSLVVGAAVVALGRWWWTTATIGRDQGPFAEDLVQTSASSRYADLKPEYLQLYESAQVRPERLAAADTIARRIAANKERYQAVAEPLGVPWYVVGLIHSLEHSLKFDGHLHNGDPLTARTVRVPAGRPTAGSPPFTWEESAQDALRLKAFDRWGDWSVPGILYKLEAYNGFGYRPRRIPTPYLWAASNHYLKGKFTRDGRDGFDPEAVSSQVGAAVLLKRMEALGLVPAVPR